MKNNDEIIVYWAPVTFDIPYICFKEPTQVIKELKDLHFKLCGDSNSNRLLNCPSVINGVRNTFAISSAIDVKIAWDGKSVTTPGRTQKFFDRLILVRDINSGFLSINFNKLIIFTEEPSLLIKQKTAVYTGNDFTKKIGIIEGMFDIGQWFRPIDVAIYFKEPGVVNIDSDDIMYYLEFFTEKKIVFKKFMHTPVLNNIMESTVSVRNEKSFPLKTYLKDIYLLFNKSKIKNKILKEIKNNLLEQ
jgi:hypothetical protein